MCHSQFPESMDQGNGVQKPFALQLPLETFFCFARELPSLAPSLCQGAQQSGGVDGSVVVVVVICSVKNELLSSGHESVFDHGSCSSSSNMKHLLLFVEDLGEDPLAQAILQLNVERVVVPAPCDVDGKFERGSAFAEAHVFHASHVLVNPDWASSLVSPSVQHKLPAEDATQLDDLIPKVPSEARRCEPGDVAFA